MNPSWKQMLQTRFAFVALAILCTILCLLLAANSCQALSYADLASAASGDERLAGEPVSLAVIKNPLQVAHVLDSLLRSVVFSANEAGQSPQKRGLDLGMTRGFSGSQAGKHLMGLSAASFANGPGK